MLSQTGSGTIRGSVLCGGSYTASGGCDLEYDQGVLDKLSQLGTRPVPGLGFARIVPGHTLSIPETREAGQCPASRLPVRS